MHNFTPFFDVRKYCASALLLFFSCSISAQSSPQAPGGVSALVYSSSAIELFWDDSEHAVEIARNGQVLGRYNTRSLFQGELNSTTTYHYSLRAVDSSGQTSEPVIVSLTTANFSLPIRQVLPVGQDNQFAPPPPPPQVASAQEQTLSQSAQSQNIFGVDINSFGAEPQQGSASAIVQTADNCIARDKNSLLSCVLNANAYQRIDIANNIRCDNNCCPSGKALLQLSNIQNLEINGHGNRLLRTNEQRQCSLLDIQNANNIQITRLHLDDDVRVSGCQVAENCPRMVHVRSSSNIGFADSRISNGKGYAFYVQGTNGFKFERSTLHNSGVLGMYIGHGNDASSNILITQSTFSDNQTNGLALLGVRGQSLLSNIVENNLFIRNHRRGQWSVAPRFGSGFTGGGQLYVAEASNVTVRNNVIKDGYCDNCFIQRMNRTGVSGIELGRPNQQSVSSIDVNNNTILNLDGFGISQNANSSLSSNVSVRDNVLLNVTTGEQLVGAQKSGNRIVTTQQFDSFENNSDLGGRFQSAVSCSNTGSVSRQCSGDTRFGQCAVQLSLGSADCNDIRASLSGPKTTIAAGQVAVLSGWVQSPVGRMCLEFSDASQNVLSEQCQQLSDAGSSDVQPYVGTPTIEAIAPGGSQSVRLRVEHRQAGATMRLDDLKLSVGAGR